MREKNIKIIPCEDSEDFNIVEQVRKLRVAAYCRVSTELEEQQLSYQTQIEHYTALIKNNPKWIFAGIYADEGKTATNTKKRTDFNRLIQDCMEEKIDMVITKSVSRFARNTVDCIQHIRKLKTKNIAVYFEKENINTLDEAGELLITILGSLAQEESRSLSTNTKWGIARRFEAGKVQLNHNRFMGYTKDEEGELVIVPEEAKVVKKIFSMYLEGMSVKNIACNLQNEGIKTTCGKEKWYDSVIFKMLRNEKYMGDVLQQKSYTVDYLTKERTKNNGKRPQYYITDDHEAIIPKEIFYKVQEELARRGNGKKVVVKKTKTKNEPKYSSKYVLGELVHCYECGSLYRRVTWSIRGKKEIVWRCIGRLKNGKRTCKNSPTIREDVLQKTVMEAIMSLTEGNAEIKEDILPNIKRVIGIDEIDEDLKEIENKIDKIRKEMIMLIEKNSQLGIENTDLDEEYADLMNKLNLLQSQRHTLEDVSNNKINNDRAVEINRNVVDQFKRIREFSPEVIKALIRSIQIVSKYELTIQFKSGEVIKQDIEY